MINVITFQVRPSLDVPFFLEHHPELAVSLQECIEDSTNLVAPPVFYIDLEGTRHVSIATYQSYDDLQAFLLELEQTAPNFMSMRDTYNRDNNISASRRIETV